MSTMRLTMTKKQVGRTLRDSGVDVEVSSEVIIDEDSSAYEAGAQLHGQFMALMQGFADASEANEGR